jgi:hypothetical protein
VFKDFWLRILFGLAIFSVPTALAYLLGLLS